MYDVMYVYNNGGDCKNTASLFVAMMGSLGFNGRVSCSIEFEHCVAIIPYTHSNEYAMVDLANNHYDVIDNGINEWDYWKDNYE